jgi:hypothetical protein
MSQRYDTFGRFTDLENPDQLTSHYVVDSLFLNDRQRLTADRPASLDDIMLMFDILLKKYETTYKSHRNDKGLLWMPYLFQEPVAGDQVKNKTTGEIYTVHETVTNPNSKLWEGLVRLRTITPPDLLKAERLEFVDPKKYVRFSENPPVKLESEGQTDERLMVDKGPIRPAIIYSLALKEPGSLDGKPFGEKKDYKKKVRETIKDPDSPNHTIEIRAQTFDNLVQFDCCTTDNFSANRLARWFEKFINLYEWVLRKNGVQQMLYMRRYNSTDSQKWRQDLIVRSLQLYFRTEEIEAISRRDLTKINYSVNLDERILDTSTRYIADQLVSGQITDEEYKALFRDSSGKYLFGNIYYNDGNL